VSARFFAFRPRGLRRALFGASALSVVLSAWALAAGHRGLEPFGTVRAVVLGALAVGFGWGWVALRPRDGFGVHLDEAGIEVARPWGARTLRIPWSRVVATRTERRPWKRLIIDIRPVGQVFIAEPLVGSGDAFRDLTRALEERRPRPPGDA
jgi:hypothetical protein